MFANPRRDAREEQKRDHRELVPETGAKRPPGEAFSAFAGCDDAGGAKLPDAPSLLFARVVNNWLCAQDTRTGCTGNVLDCIIAALSVCSRGAILAT